MTEAQRMSLRQTGDAKAITAGSPRRWPMVAALAWKELAEAPSGAMLGVVALTGTTWIGLASRLLPDEAVIAAILIGGAIILPILAAMGVSAPERAAGTIGLLRVLPVRPAMAYSIKLAVAIITVLLPIATSSLLAMTIAGGRELARGQMGALLLLGAWLAVVHTIWIAGLSVRQPTEARVALVGAAFYVGQWMLFMAVDACGDLNRWGWLVAWLPAGLASTRGYDYFIPGVRMGIATLAAAGVWWWSARRFAQPEKPR